MGGLIALLILGWLLSLFIRSVGKARDKQRVARELKIYEEKLKLDAKYGNTGLKDNQSAETLPSEG